MILKMGHSKIVTDNNMDQLLQEKRNFSKTTQCLIVIKFYFVKN